ncbi:hypothetical protein [Orenia marismortui]|uniref:SpoIIAA-like protein n=1 Tax=Orenia marismortui TaxID=46469 RepID=A0A4R8GH78_9FIRM|nr:hypothetical protein [Orenia marismortui]TDX43618.1 hypothetical protein C7959_1629 [Orenia marismortui]
MYHMKVKEEFIVVSGSDIIDEIEARAICRKLKDLLALRADSNKLMLDVREVNLEDSKFDIFIQSLSKFNIDKISIILPELINKIKFRLWRRKYSQYVSIEQFLTFEEGKKWLKKE